MELEDVCMKEFRVLEGSCEELGLCWACAYVSVLIILPYEEELSVGNSRVSFLKNCVQI